jgi:spermidine synthase
VVVAGAAVMVVEILGSRILAPTFGTTLHVWSALITVALVALAAGYATGGRLADRRPPLPSLMAVLGGATASLLLAGALAPAVLPLAYRAGLVGGTFVAASVLFLLPLLLLGMVSPLAVRATADFRTLGQSVGGLYALSTAGSVAGSLTVSLVLIPRVSVHTALAVTAAALALVPLAYLAGRRRAGMAAAGALGLGAALAAGLALGHRADRETRYKGGAYPVTARLPSAYGDLVVADRDGVRYLFLNGVQQGALRREGVSGALYAWGLQRVVTARGLPRTALVWGLGAGVVVRALAEAGVEVTAIEIDPAALRAARDHFGLPASVRVVLGDARTETARLASRYDAIVLDAFAGDTPPFHLLTRQAFQAVADRLAPGGLVAVNLVGSVTGPGARPIAAVARTMEAVLGPVTALAPNLALFGHGRPGFVSTVFLVAGPLPEDPAPFPFAVPPDLRRYVEAVLASRVALPRAGAVLLTDAYAPLDAWQDRAVEAMRY